MYFGLRHSVLPFLTRLRIAIRSFITRSNDSCLPRGAERIVQPPVQRVQFGVDLGMFLDRLVHRRLDAGHLSLRLLDLLVSPADHGPEDRGAQGTRLRRAADLHRPIADVGVDLHHERVLFGDAATVDHLLDLDAVFLKPVDDRQRAERRGFDQRPVDFGGRGVQRLPDQQAAQQRVDQNRAVAVVPVQGQQPAFARRQPLGFARQIHVRIAFGRVLVRRQVSDEPIEDIAHRRLAGLQPIHARQDRPRHDAAQSRDIGQRLVLRRDHHVASAGADDLDQRPRLDPRAHGAHVGIERAHGHRDARRQADFLGRLGGQPARLLVGRHGLVCITLADFHQVRVQRSQERLAGQPAPRVVVHRLVARRAHAAGQGLRIRVAGDERRNKIGQFHPGVGRREHLGRRAFAVQDLGPEPFAGIGPAALAQVMILRAPPPWP